MDGYLAAVDADAEASDSKSQQAPVVQALQKIPKNIVQNAAGIAVFTCMRNGLWMTGSGGSGILIARKSDGTWSPPSGIMLHTPTLSFIMGVDIYDCVLIVTDLTVLELLTRPSVTLGEDVILSNGPVVALDSEENRHSWKEVSGTVMTYLKARGQDQTVNLNGCILTERANENERFYGSQVTQMEVLAGNVARHVEETKPLFEVLKMAEGRTDFDEAVIKKTAIQPAPGDAIIATPKGTPVGSRNVSFGIPMADDPDPYGVLALEMAGLEIREAGTQARPASSQFDFGFGPVSPNQARFARQSIEARGNRASHLSARTVKSHLSETTSPLASPTFRHSEDSNASPTDEVDYTAIDTTALRHLSQELGLTHPITITEEEEEHEQLPVHREEEEEQQQPKSVQAKEPTAKVLTAKVEGPKPLTINKFGQKAKVASAAAATAVGVGAASSFAARLAMFEKHDPEPPTMVKLAKPDGTTAASLKGSAESPIDDDEAKKNRGDIEADDADDEDMDMDEDEEPVVFEVAAVQPTRTQAIASRVIHARGNVVTIAKRGPPPPLPCRSPARSSRNFAGTAPAELKLLSSPLRESVSEADLRTEPKDGDESPEFSRTKEISKLVKSESLPDGFDHDSESAEVAPLSIAVRDKELTPAILAVASEPVEGRAAEESIVDSDDEARPDANDMSIVENVSHDVSTVTEAEPTLAAVDTTTDLEATATSSDIANEKFVSANDEHESMVASDSSDHLSAEDKDSVAQHSDDESKEASFSGNLDDYPTDEEDEEAVIAEAQEAVLAVSVRNSARLSKSTVSTRNSARLSKSTISTADETSSIRQIMVASPSVEGNITDLEKLSALSTVDDAKEVVESEEDEVEGDGEESTKQSPEPALSVAATDDGDDAKEDESQPSTPQNESAEHSDSASHKKHTSSIFTGATDRWSFHDSSLTTPTSDRPTSVASDIIDDGTPTKTLFVDRGDKKRHSVVSDSDESTPTHTLTVS